MPSLSFSFSLLLSIEVKEKLLLLLLLLLSPGLSFPSLFTFLPLKFFGSDCGGFAILDFEVSWFCHGIYLCHYGMQLSCFYQNMRTDLLLVAFSQINWVNGSSAQLSSNWNTQPTLVALRAKPFYAARPELTYRVLSFTPCPYICVIFQSTSNSTWKGEESNVFFLFVLTLNSGNN